MILHFFLLARDETREILTGRGRRVTGTVGRDVNNADVI